MNTRITRPIPRKRKNHVAKYLSSEFLSLVSARHNARVGAQSRLSRELDQGRESSYVRAIKLARQGPDLLGGPGVAALDVVAVPGTVDAIDDGQSNTSGTSLGDGEIRWRDASLLAASGVATELRGGVLNILAAQADEVETERILNESDPIQVARYMAESFGDAAYLRKLDAEADEVETVECEHASWDGRFCEFCGARLSQGDE